jgi:hypothetical protein
MSRKYIAKTNQPERKRGNDFNGSFVWLTSISRLPACTAARDFLNAPARFHRHLFSEADGEGDDED